MIEVEWAHITGMSSAFLPPSSSESCQKRYFTIDWKDWLSSAPENDVQTVSVYSFFPPFLLNFGLGGRAHREKFAFHDPKLVWEGIVPGVVEEIVHDIHRVHA
jgi:hypothetical protein